MKTKSIASVARRRLMNFTPTEKRAHKELEAKLVAEAKAKAILAVHVFRATEGQRGKCEPWGGYPSEKAAREIVRVACILDPRYAENPFPLVVKQQRNKKFPFSVTFGGA